MPARPQPEPAKEEAHVTGLMGATMPDVGGLGSLATDFTAAAAEGWATAANTRTSAQQPRGGGATAEAHTATAPLLQYTPAAGRGLRTVGPVTPTRTVEEQAAAAAEGAGGGAGAGAGAPPRSVGGGLFTALLDNISLSQIMQSQGTTQGTTGSQGEGGHAGGGDAAGGNTNTSSSSGSKPDSPSGARGTGAAAACAQEEEAEDEARRYRGGSGGAAAENSSRPADIAEATDAPQGGGLWSASRLGPLGSLALLDSEDDHPPAPWVGADATGRARSTSPAPRQSCTATDGACCDRPQQQQLSPQPGGGGTSATGVAGGRGPLSPARSSSGTAPARAVAEAPPSLPPPSPPAAAGTAGTAAAVVSVANPSPSPAGLGETAPQEDGAGKILPVPAAPPVRDESLVQEKESDVVGLPAVGLQKAAAAGERDASPTKAVAREACDGGVGGRGADAAAVADDGPAGVVAGNGSEREEDSPAFSAGSSLNLALSLTPEV